MAYSLYEDITQQIIAELENGTVPWKKPWAVAIPYNAVSQQPYHGINVLMLWKRRFEPSAWITFRQARELGGTVKKGEKGTQVVYASKKAFENEDGEKEEKFFLRYYHVFNIDQCEDLPRHLYKATAEDPNRIPKCEDFVKHTEADIRHGGTEAYYSHADYIQVPPASDFDTIEHYYATLLHELTHFTGAPHRLNRDLSGYFGGVDYAKEELVAELGAAFLCAHLGIQGELRHAGYIQSWLRALENDKRLIFWAAREAQKAADYLIHRETAAAHPGYRQEAL